MQADKGGQVSVDKLVQTLREFELQLNMDSCCGTRTRTCPASLTTMASGNCLPDRQREASCSRMLSRRQYVVDSICGII